MCGVRSPGRLGGGCESCCDGRADKSSSIHGRHFTPSGSGGTTIREKKEGQRCMSKDLESFPRRARAESRADSAACAVNCGPVSGSLQRRGLPRAAGLLDDFCYGEHQLVFEGAAYYLYADGESFVRKGEWYGSAGKAGQV